MNQSISANSQSPVTRRKFIQFLLGFSVVSTIGGILVPIIAYLIPKEATAGLAGPAEVGKVEDFPPNASKVVSVADKPVIVVNTKTGGLKAFSAICTHLGCIVSWNASRSSIHCPCHDGFFNPVTGAVVSGPPPKPLAAYEVVVKDNKVFVGKQLG